MKRKKLKKKHRIKTNPEKKKTTNENLSVDKTSLEKKKTHK